jgi:hypothetical protein
LHAKLRPCNGRIYKRSKFRFDQAGGLDTELDHLLITESYMQNPYNVATNFQKLMIPFTLDGWYALFAVIWAVVVPEFRVPSGVTHGPNFEAYL